MVARTSTLVKKGGVSFLEVLSTYLHNWKHSRQEEISDIQPKHHFYKFIKRDYLIYYEVRGLLRVMEKVKKEEI